MSKIGGRPPGVGPVEVPPGASQPADAGKSVGTESKTTDQFVRGGQAVQQPSLESSKLQAALAGKVTSAKVQFSNEEIAYLATTFASILKQNPNASRTKRAKLYAKAILKHKKLRKLFAGVPEEQMDAMYDAIAEQLDSPVFAELVDEVTEGAGKLNVG